MARKMLQAMVLFMSPKSAERLPTYIEMDEISGIEAMERERRKRTRMRVHWPVCFFRPDTGDVVKTVTHDLSSDGFYCLANTTFIPGESGECTLGVPTRHPTGGEHVISVQCKVRIIRVETLGESGLYGVGCRIEDYHFTGSPNGDGSHPGIAWDGTRRNRMSAT